MTQKPSIATTILLCPFYRDLPKNKVHLGCALSISYHGAIGLIEVGRSWAFGSVVSKVSLALSVRG